MLFSGLQVPVLLCMSFSNVCKKKKKGHSVTVHGFVFTRPPSAVVRPFHFSYTASIMKASRVRFF